MSRQWGVQPERVTELCGVARDIYDSRNNHVAQKKYGAAILCIPSLPGRGQAAYHRLNEDGSLGEVTQRMDLTSYAAELFKVCGGDLNEGTLMHHLNECRVVGYVLGHALSYPADYASGRIDNISRMISNDVAHEQGVQA